MRNGRTLKNVRVLAAAAALAMAAGACSEDTVTTYEPKAVWSVVQTDDVTVTNTDGQYAVDFGTVAVGTKAQLAVEVRNDGSAPMTIPAVTTLLAPFSTDIPPAGLVVGVAEKKTIKVFFSPAEETAYSWPGGADFGAIAVQGFAAQNLGLRLTGVGQRPAFSCDATELDFGRIVKGGQQDLTLNCTNNSDVDGVLIVLPIIGEDQALFRHPYPQTVNEGKVPVAAGATLPIKVTFRADRSGQASATLQIESERSDDDVPDRVARVQLKGYTIDHAISCAPNVLNFGFVAPNSEKHMELVCSNAATAPFQLTSIILDASSHQGVFSWTPDTFPIEVPARAEGVDGSVTIDVVFAPKGADSGARRNGILVISSTDSSTTRLDVNMTGFAGGPELSCTPGQIDFGVVAKGIPVTRSFVCANIGTDDPGSVEDSLVVTGIETTNPTEFEAVPAEPFRASGYLIGETFTVNVKYNPADDGIDSAAAVIHSNATNGPPEAPFSVSLTGNGRDLPPCDFEIVPARLRYGIVEKGNTATLEFAVRNNQADECLIQNLRLAPTCDSAFSLPGGEVALDVLSGNGEKRYPVSFSPQAYRSEAFTCDVLFDISNPENPHQVVPASGASQEPCALIAPNDLDFGTLKPGCASRDREFQIINTCAGNLILGEIALNEGVSDEFFIRSFPPPGTAIAPGLSQIFTMAYRPEDEGVDLGSVFVYVQGTSEPYLATLRGRAALDATQTDSFEQNDRPKVDLLWVIDNSGSMSEEQAIIGTNLRPFLSFAQAQEIDYQIGVTTSGLSSPCGNPGGAGGAEDGRLFPVDNSRPRIITPNTPNMEAVWAANFAVGTCHYDEQEMEAAFRALHPPVIDNCDDPRHPEPNDGNCGFLRREAHLSIIAVTDEVDQSPGTVNFYYNAFLSLKGFRNTHLFNFHAITGDRATGCSRSGTGSAEAGDKLIAMVEKTDGGVFQSICAPDWEASLREMSAAAFGFKTCFFLGNQPEDTNGNGLILDTEGEIQVRMNGRVTPAKGDQGQQIWSYSQEQIAICFNPLAVPEPGTQLDISYRVACLSW